jgi:hypothetical protein
MTDNYSVCFIIAHKYYRNYESYIQIYVDNILKFYKDSLCIIVDNNSKYIEDIINKLKDYKNVIILSNDSQCKFEIGAYKVGIYDLIEKNLLNKYNYVVFSQDTFVLKSKYDFNELVINNDKALPFHACLQIPPISQHSYFHHPHSLNILKKIHLDDKIDLLRMCWCNSFILHNSKIMEFLEITKDLIITNRYESECSERYLSGILYYLNNYKLANVYSCHKDGTLSYNFFTVCIKTYENDIYPFVKRFQRKTEHTVDE